MTQLKAAVEESKTAPAAAKEEQMANWRFPILPETTVLTLRAILEKQRAINFVERDERGGWHFFDGRTAYEISELVLVPLKLVIDLDTSIEEVADLPQGWRAWREQVSGIWERESSRTRERTRAKGAEALAYLRNHSVALPPGSPSVVEMIREDRDR